MVMAVSDLGLEESRSEEVVLVGFERGVKVSVTPVSMISVVVRRDVDLLSTLTAGAANGISLIDVLASGREVRSTVSGRSARRFSVSAARFGLTMGGGESGEVGDG